ncbi:hypothetical protein LOK49_LG10G01691 [Camellia lanceoleosa]|uniref:Uncharacterized protein n=1 Tax=Camellia lanceoleosa TaxID=1840588 RepID=A0ACC0G928_9ERIC|nr:hypothetical protein LOK49_LG10G01691 [Camellia lanceoleosa]
MSPAVAISPTEGNNFVEDWDRRWDHRLQNFREDSDDERQIRRKEFSTMGGLQIALVVFQMGTALEQQGFESGHDMEVTSPESRERAQFKMPNWEEMERFYVELETTPIMELAIDQQAIKR